VLSSKEAGVDNSPHAKRFSGRDKAERLAEQSAVNRSSSFVVTKPPPSVYLVLLLVFLGLALITSTLPAYSVLQAISALPALGALIAALFQVFREQAAFERQLLLQQQQQAFSTIAVI